MTLQANTQFELIKQKIDAVILKSAPHARSLTRINVEDNLRSDLSLDSLALVTLMTFLEIEFQFNAQEHFESLLKIKTVRDIIEFIEALPDIGLTKKLL